MPKQNKRFLISLVLIVPIIHAAYATDDEIYSQMLDARLEQLIQERDAKAAQLEKCAKGNKNFKIATAITAATTAYGVSLNVQLHNRLKNGTSGGGGTTSTFTDTRPQAEKDCDSIAMLCELGDAECCAQKC